ncbi:hypothetical protein WJX81_003286 [Elliptochloris bilobata]|uniref:RNA polymerase sigma-70 domain-containing protein n=1 Tax=Elliptochloris bilobata TaxID=381761 RepID=A0AAW1RND1_9CHLO
MEVREGLEDLDAPVWSADGFTPFTEEDKRRIEDLRQAHQEELKRRADEKAERSRRRATARAERKAAAAEAAAVAAAALEQHAQAPAAAQAGMPALSSMAPGYREFAGVSSNNTAAFFKSVGAHQLLSADEEKELARRVQGLMALQAIAAPEVERLGRSLKMHEWAALAGESDVAAFTARVQEGREARERMIACNQRLVISVARKYMNRGMAMADLISEGLLGLVRGMEKFDANRGFKFSTYAHWWIRQAITRALSEQARVVRLPVHLHELMSKVRKEEANLRHSLQRKPTGTELATAANITEQKLAMLLKVYKLPASLEAPLPHVDNGLTLGDVLPSEEAHDEVDRATTSAELRADLDNVLCTLSPREAGVLRARYGLDDGRARTLEDIGQAFQVTRERIRQIEAKAILKLRHPNRSRSLRGYLEEAEEQNTNDAFPVAWAR